MKSVYLCCLLLIAFEGISQNLLEIYPFQQPGNNIDGDTIFMVDPTANEFVYYIKTACFSNDTHKIRIRTTEVNVVAQTESSTCWEVCPPYVSAGDQPVRVSSRFSDMTNGSLNESFAAHYKPKGTNGVSLFMYEWIDENNGNAVMAKLYISYNHLASSLASHQKKETMFSSYPNPVKDVLIVESLEVAGGNYFRVELVALDGKILLIKAIEGNQQKLDLSHIPSGMYLLRIKSENEILGQQKVVKN